MFFSANLSPSNSNFAPNFASLTSKSSVFQAPTIHSTKTRNGLFSDGTNFGKLHNSSLRRATSNQRSGTTEYYQSKAERPLTAQNWRKNLSVNIKEEELETGLRDYLGISQPFRPKTSTSKENTSIFQQRAGTSHSNKRVTAMGMSSVKSVKSILHIPSTVETDGMLRRDLMCQTDETEMNDFSDEKAQEKFQYIKFIKAPSKEFLKLLRLSNYDVTLVPSDARRVVVEAILREFFLNIIPENSDYLICKNTQTQIYTILFTGRLVATCKICSSVARFEISRDLGFQVLCNSQYCNIKVLYQTKLNDKTRECLWPSSLRFDIEHSLPIKDAARKPLISKLIQSGKYKNTDFSKIISNISTPDPLTRPNTTANIMRNVGSASRLNRRIIKTSFTEKAMLTEGNQRPNTVQGLRMLGSRPDTAGSMSGSLDNKDFKGVSILKEFDDKGLFAKEIENIGVIEQVSEEMSEQEEEKVVVPKKILEEMKKREIRKPVQATKKPLQRKKNKEKLTEKLEAYAIPRLSENKSLFVGNDNSGKLDNSLEEIHNMVNILSK